MVSRRLAFLALCLAFPAPGCCTLARLFCGADDSEWVQISYRTPRQALATFKEAVRRDNCQVIYDSLGEGFKERNGLGLLEACMAWEKLKGEYTGLHLLGYAEDTELSSTATRAAYELEVSGYRFRVDLVRQDLWTVFTDVERAEELSDWAAFGSMVQRRQVGGREVLALILPEPEAYARDVLSIEDLSLGLENYQEIRVSREWKVDGFAPTEDTG